MCGCDAATAPDRGAAVAVAVVVGEAEAATTGRSLPDVLLLSVPPLPCTSAALAMELTMKSAAIAPSAVRTLCRRGHDLGDWL